MALTAVLALALGALAGCGGATSSPSAESGPGAAVTAMPPTQVASLRTPARKPPRPRRRDLTPGSSGGATAPDDRPNIVFVLTDDLDVSLVKYMPHVEQMEQQGVTFSNYFVTDSLCCPSRSSIFTGRFPHNTGVFTNSGPDGGWNAFHDRGEEDETFATALHAAGYRTALMGKYLNEYPARPQGPGLPPYVPPGWDEWDVAGNGYPEYGYNMATTAGVTHHGHRASDYLTNVIANSGLDFIDQAVDDRQPFMLELSTFAPHEPATPAPQDRGRFPNVTAPRDASFNEADMSDKPAWIRNHPALGPLQIARIDAAYRKRVRAVQAVDRMLARIERRLTTRGIAQNTYIVFSSDNGYHMGQHRLTPGKLTAYDTDIHVPLIVTGPDVPAGQTVPALAENIDLCPTFSELGGATPPPNADGKSLVPLMHGELPVDWRSGVLVEHRGRPTSPSDPDFAPAGSGNPPTYEALRTADSLYVEYDDGEREYYDLRTDPLELDNIADALTPEHALALHDAVTTMRGCLGTDQCWSAQHTPD